VSAVGASLHPALHAAGILLPHFCLRYCQIGAADHAPAAPQPHYSAHLAEVAAHHASCLLPLPPSRSNLEPNIFSYTALLALPRHMSEGAAPELLDQVGWVRCCWVGRGHCIRSIL
jgi:hypothetical protein